MLLVLLAAAALVHAPAAMAHEFRITMIVADGPDGDEFLAGFRLAVDRSPDVSHPSGVESGDHLGGVDVDVELLRAGRGGGDLEAELRAALSRGSGIVVLTGSDTTPGAARIGDLVAAADALFIASRVDATLPAGSIVMTPRRSDDNAGQATDIEDAFAAARGRAATQPALAGYDAAALVDAVVAELGHDIGPRDLDAEILRRTDKVLTSTIATIAPGRSEAGRSGAGRSGPGEAPASGTPPDDTADAAIGVGTAVFVASAAALALASFALLRHRRRRRPDRAVRGGSESQA